MKLTGQELWSKVREKYPSATDTFRYFFYEMTDEERALVRPYLNLTLLLIWALAEPRGVKGAQWTVDQVTKRVLG